MSNPNIAKEGEETQFKQGESGNPDGRPKGVKNISTLIREYIEQEIDMTDPIDGQKKKNPIKNVLALRLISNALKGDHRALQEVMDRLEGKPLQKQEIKQDIDQLKIRIVHENGKGNNGDDRV